MVTHKESTSMKQHYVMGIDNGGTVTKAAIYDRAGNVVASASKSTQMLTPKEFHTERDINELWAANVEDIALQPFSVCSLAVR